MPHDRESDAAKVLEMLDCEHECLLPRFVITHRLFDYLSAVLTSLPARRLRLMSLRPLDVFMRARKPIRRLRRILLTLRS